MPILGGDDGIESGFAHGMLDISRGGKGIGAKMEKPTIVRGSLGCILARYLARHAGPHDPLSAITTAGHGHCAVALPVHRHENNMH